MRWRLSTGVILGVVILGGLSPGPYAMGAEDIIRVAGHVSVPSQPTAVVLSPDGARVYVTSAQESVLTALDAASLQVLWTASIPGGADDVALAPSGALGYVASSQSRSVSVVDLRDGSVRSTITVAAGADALAVTPDGAQVWVMSSGGEQNLTGPPSSRNAGTLTVISARTLRAVRTMRAGTIPHDVLISPSGARAYVLSWGSNQIWSYNARSYRILDRIATRSWPMAMAINPDGSRLLIAHSIPGAVPAQPVTTINTSKRAVVGVFRLPIDIEQMAINRSRLTFPRLSLDAGEALIAATDDDRGALAIINLRDQEVVSTTALGAVCDHGALMVVGLAVATDTRRAYVINECLGSSGILTAIDLVGAEAA